MSHGSGRGEIRVSVNARPGRELRDLNPLVDIVDAPFHNYVKRTVCVHTPFYLGRLPHQGHPKIAWRFGQDGPVKAVRIRDGSDLGRLANWACD
jgi:hypothetical protein